MVFYLDCEYLTPLGHRRHLRQKRQPESLYRQQHRQPNRHRTKGPLQKFPVCKPRTAGLKASGTSERLYLFKNLKTDFDDKRLIKIIEP